MNNLIFENMKKVAVFNGLINGEKYDNVADYNAKMNELLQNNIEVQASSSTSIKYVMDESNPTSGYVSTCTDCDCANGVCTHASTNVDEDLSFYPYMEDNDPFYLDLLVTEDPVTNQEAYVEAQKVLEKCYRYILTELNSTDVTNEDRKEYFDSIVEILSNIDADIVHNNNAMDSINAKRKKLSDDFDAEMSKLAREEELLKGAAKVSGMFKAYYGDVSNEILISIKEHESEASKYDKNNNKKNCICNNEISNVNTSCEEKRSQLIADFNALIDKIFGPDANIYKR